MNYHVFHDSFTSYIKHSGIFDLFPKISIYENKSQDFGRVEGSFQNRRVKGSEAPTCLTQSAMTHLSGVCQQPALTDNHRRHQEEGRRTT